MTAKFAEPEIQKSSWARVFAWDVMAVALISLSSFASFLGNRGYSFFGPESFLACSIIIAIALIVTIVMEFRPNTLRPLIITLLVVVFLHMENELYLPQWLSSWSTVLSEPDIHRIFRIIIYVLPMAVIFFIIRDKLSIIVSVIFGTIILSGLVLPLNEIQSVTVVERDPPVQVIGTAAPPVVLHLIIDQQIGVAGLPAEIEGTPEMRDAMLSLYDRFGFRHYTNAFSHFSITLESVPDLLNGSVEPSARYFVGRQGGKSRVVTNDWFKLLGEQGYEIEVFQSDYLDFCYNEDYAIFYCYSRLASDIRPIKDLDITPVQKAALLLYHFFDEDYALLSRSARLAWYFARQVASRMGLDLPAWTERSIKVSTPLTGLATLAAISERLESATPGTAIFGHILLPHDPYILDEECNIKTDLQSWKQRESALWFYGVASNPERRKAHYAEYYKQVRCLNGKLAGLFEVLDRRGLLDDATVIVHGDHGSRISLIEPVTGREHDMTPQDITDSFSTLFSVRGAGIEPGVVEDQRSIQAIFAEELLGRDEIVEHNTIFLWGVGGVLGSDQARLKMVPLPTLGLQDKALSVKNPDGLD